MKKLFSLFLPSILLVSYSTIGQIRQKIGSNATNIAVSATLELESTTRGFLPPRMTHQQRNDIVSPVAGLIVWCTNCCPAGELQVYNGIGWANMIGGTASLAVPGAPTSTVATFTNSYASATVAFTPPAYDGGSPITGYTVTSSPGGFTATGSTSPLFVSGLNIGTSYTFTVVASNAMCNSVASTTSNPVTIDPPLCGAYLSEGIFKIFSCYNLGADSSLNPHVPVQAIHGNYYQWGRANVVANASTDSGTIADWNTSEAGNGSWADNNKTTNDPCPIGFRVPTRTQWEGVLNTPWNNITREGSWGNEGNFTTAIHLGNNLTLPAAGYRYPTNGMLVARGIIGNYWSSSEFTSDAKFLSFWGVGANISTGVFNRSFGMSVRCISE